MPHAASFYSNGHLTRRTRRHLARLYIEAEQKDTLSARIARHQSKHHQQQAQPQVNAEDVNGISKQEQVSSHGKPVANITEAETHAKVESCETNLTRVPEGELDKMVMADMRRTQWGDLQRQMPRTTDMITPRSKKDLNWGSIIQYEQHQFEATMRKLHQERELAKERYRQSLFEQMQRHKDQEHQTEIANQHEVEERRKQLELYSEQNKKQAAQYHKKTEELKSSRIQQIKEREKQRALELNEAKEMQKRAAECLRRKLDADKAYAIAKKEESRKVQWELILENNRERAAKNAVAEKELQENKHLQKLYADLLDKQEQERLKAIEIRHEKQRQHDAGYESIRKQRDDLLRKEEERIAHDQQMIAEMQMNRDKADAEMRQKALDENQAILRTQIQEKLQRRAAVKQVELEYKEKLIEIARHDRQRAEIIAIESNHEKRRLQEELQQQIAQLEDKRLLQKVEMTDIERCLNQNILNRIAKEEHLE